MVTTREPRTIEQIRQCLNYSFHTADPFSFRDEFLERRTAFLATLPEEASADPVLDAASGTQELARIVLTACDFLPTDPVKTGQEFATCALLVDVLHCMAEDVLLSREQLVVVHTLQKRFEVHRRIFDRYSATVHRTGDSYTDLTLYALFSLVLMLLFKATGRFAYLNTAMKITDLIVVSGWEINAPCPIRLCLLFEREILGGGDAL